MEEEHPPLKITVATVTYEDGERLVTTIKSIEEQDYPYVEHVIVDGNSQDDTLVHIHHYQERNSLRSVRHEINCLSEPDEGLYDAMNKALDMATGDYIVFLNAGDRFHAANTLSQVAALAEKAHPGVVYGDTQLVNDQGNFLRRRRLRPPKRLTWKTFQAGMLVCHQSFYALITIARTTRYNLDYRYSADFDWCIRVLIEVKKRGLDTLDAKAILTDYLEGEGLTKTHHKASLVERYQIMVRHYGLFSTTIRHMGFVFRALFKK